MTISHPAPTVRRGYADGALGQVHYRVCGAGAPLVLCHQSPNSSSQFEAAYGRLAARGYRAIGVDNPGFGQSDTPATTPTIADFADAVISVLDHLGVARAHVLGQHTGSMVAMDASIRYPARFASLILNSPTPFSPKQRAEWIDSLVARQRGWKVKADGAHLQELWDRRINVAPGWTDLHAMHRNVIDMLLAGDTLWYGHHASLVYDQLAQLKAVRHPTLVLNNTGDALFELCKSAMQVRPDFAYAELAGGTHDIVDEQPDAWCNAVHKFAQTIPLDS